VQLTREKMNRSSDKNKVTRGKITLQSRLLRSSTGSFATRKKKKEKTKKENKKKARY
jgi:hypothetical protein